MSPTFQGPQPRPRSGRSTTRWTCVAPSLLLLGTVCLFSSASGCDCSGAEPVAELVELHNAVDRDWADKLNQWEGAVVGATFALGDGLRTGEQAQARLEFSAGGQLRVGSGSLVRLSASAPTGSGASNTGVEIVTGGAELLAGPAAMRFLTKIGPATVAPNSRVRVIGTGGSVRYEVSVGSARVERTHGSTHEVQAGQGIEVAIGSAEIERFALNRAQEHPPEQPAQEPASITAVVSGRAASSRVPGASAWRRLGPGEHNLAEHSELRVKRRGSVKLRKGDEAASLGGGRYVVGGAEGALVQITRGKLSLGRASDGVSIKVPGGVIATQSGSDKSTSAILRVNTARDTRLRVQQGTLVVRHAGGVHTVRAGQSWRLSSAQSDRTSDSETADLDTRGPEHAEVALPAGESAAIHDPRPPLDLAFATALKCPGGAEVRVAGRSRTRASGKSHVHVKLHAGTHGYRVRCLRSGRASGRTVARGRLRILRDPGTARLPATAPASEVDTDGRRYTVMYQNRLPAIRVRWPTAPQADGYELEVTSLGRGTRAFASDGARHAFKSGVLGEGQHQLTFRVLGGGERSEPTTLRIRFDNAAPAASLREPADRSFAAGATVAIRGVALAGWQASVGGAALDMDRYHRFEGEVEVPRDARSLIIRIAHPKRGVHYYVRRPAGASP